MGKVNRGFNLTAMNGSVGAVTYVTRRGVTVAKQKVPAVLKYTKTVRSMYPRMRWMAIVRMWQKLNSVGWHPSFQNKQGLQSDFNMFIKANSSVNVFLPKNVTASNGAVVIPVQLTQGGLPTIGGNLLQDGFHTTISMGGQVIGASTTLQNFSAAIIENNDAQGWDNGDQLTIVRLVQTVDENNVPRITADINEVVLDVEDDETLLGDLLPANLLTVVNGTLTVSNATGVAVVHSKGFGDDYDVSTEFLKVTNEEASEYEGEAALMRAINSYGGLSAVQFLVP